MAVSEAHEWSADLLHDGAAGLGLGRLHESWHSVDDCCGQMGRRPAPPGRSSAQKSVQVRRRRRRARLAQQPKSGTWGNAFTPSRSALACRRPCRQGNWMKAIADTSHSSTSCLIMVQQHVWISSLYRSSQEIPQQVYSSFSRIMAPAHQKPPG